jgi:hypothetical protein
VLFKQTALIALTLILTACSGNPTLEGKFSADPQLQTSPQNNPTPQASPNIPPEIPIYENAQLLETVSGKATNPIVTRWQSPDPSNLIESFYLQYLQKNEWEILSPNSLEQPTGEIVARRNNAEIRLTVEANSPETIYLMTFDNGTTNAVIPSPSPSPINNPVTPNPVTFSDIEQIPPPVRNFVQDLGNLGVITPYQGTQFNPNVAITRREFARWLVQANNTLFANNPGKQLRLSYSGTAFQDVKPNDPDFPYIQGLADAGLIPSSLRGDSNALLFRPNAPLTREDLIRQKVALDTRQLPDASVESIKQTWGFQDVNKIDPLVLRHLYADYQNGDQANIRRVLGYTTLFQPKKPITRAEAAAALWYFGYQGDGISAADILQNPNQANNQQ